MTSQYPGKRLSFNNALCTVRYCGPLPGQNGDWLGVEWDDPNRGKHDGLYKGKRLFDTLSPSPICASFIRATRIPDEPRSFLQALRYKYAEDDLEQVAIDPIESIQISGKVVEEVGFEKIRNQQAVLNELKIVLLDGLRICGAGVEAAVETLQEEIANTCPNIAELDLSRNLFEHWNDIADICAPLKKLRVLKASGLRLLASDSTMPSAFRIVEEIHLNDGLLKPEQIIDMLCRRTADGLAELLFPSLSSLSISGNNLSTFHSTTSRAVNPVIPTIKTLIMDMNAVSSLVQLCNSLVPLFPNLTALSLQHNQISTFNPLASSSEECLPVYPSIMILNLSHNAITTPTLISSLPQIFPNLASLRVSHNPLFSSSPAANNAHHHGTEDAAFMLTLARLPTLTMLNYSAITEKDRTDGELYYLSVAENDIRNAFEARADGEELDRVLRDWGRYDELCRKYERENFLEELAAKSAEDASDSLAIESAGPAKQKPKYPPKSLGARLVTFTFVLHPTNTSTDTNTNTNNRKKAVSLTLPRTLDVYRVKGLLMRKIGREWGLRPLSFAFEVLQHHETAAVGSGVPEEEGEVEVEVIPDSTRRIGDWIPDGVRECVVRVKPGLDRRKAESELERMDVARLVAMAPS